MKKPAALRAYLSPILAQLRTDPDALDLHVTRGSIATRHGPNLGYEYRYELVVTLFAWRCDPAQFFLPLVIWLRQHQPELLLNHDKGASAIRFEADMLTGDEQDIIVTLPLTEAVDVLPRANGSGYDYTVRDEPAIIDTDPFADVPPTTLLRQIFRDGELLCGYPDP